MKKFYLNAIISFIVILIIGTVLTVGTLADVGNANRRSSSSRSSSSRHRSSDSTGRDLPVGVSAMISIIIVVLYIRGIIKKNISKNPTWKVTTWHSSSLPPVNPRHTNLGALKQRDPGFNEQEMLGKAKETFIALQAAWTARDWKAARLLESDTLFNMHKTQLDEYIRDGKINVVERIYIEKAQIRRFYDNNENEFLDIALTARMRDYIIDEHTRQVLEGDPLKDYRMGYTLTFMRTKGLQTEAQSTPASAGNCPNCGAPLELSAASECAYCGTLVMLGNFSWVLDKLEGQNLL